MPKTGSRRAWRFSFRAHVIALVAASVLPLTGLGVYSMLRLAAAERDADASEIVSVARAVSASLDHEFQHDLIIMRAFASRLPRDSDDLQEFYRDCDALASESGGWMLLADKNGDEFFNTKRPFGTVLPRLESHDFKDTVAAGAPRVSNLLLGTVDQQPQYTIFMPVLENGEVTHVLAMSFPRSRLNGLLRAQHLPAEWAVSVVDRNDTIIAKPDDAAPLIGQQSSPEIRALPPEQSEAFLRVSHKLGIPVYIGTARSALSGWRVVIGIPVDFVEGPLRQTLWRFGLLGGALLLATLGIASLIGGHLSATIRRLALAAHALARRETMPAVGSTVDEVSEVARALAEADAARSAGEDRLRRSEQHLLQAQHIAGMGSVARNFRTGEIECSEEVFRIFGAERFEPTLENMLALTHPDDREALRQATHAAEAGITPTPLEYRILRFDGEIRILRREGELVHDAGGAVAGSFVTLLDVTELRSAEERQRQLEQKLLYAQQNEAARLRESEARLRRSQQHLAVAQRVSRTGSVLYDIAREQEEWSDELYRINGLKRGEKPETFATVLALVPEEDRPKLVAVKAALEKGEVPTAIYYRLRRPDGELRVIQLDVAPLDDAEERLNQVVVTLRDVTELHAAQEQLRRSQQHLALAQRVSRTGSVLHDIANDTDEWSDELYHITGLVRGKQPEALGSFLALVHEADRGQFIEAKAALMRGEQPRVTQCRLRRPDGEARVIQVDVAPLGGDNGPPTHVIVTLRDVTALHAAEEQVRRSQQHLTQAQRVSHIGSVLHDVRSGTDEWSEELYRILGVAPGTMPASFETFIGLVDPADRPAIFASMAAFARGERRQQDDYRITRPDGAVRLIHSEIEPLLDEAGQPSQLLVTFVDVTELRAAEARERELERQLHHAQKLEALGTLAGGIAHDLNNTLVPVLSLSKLTMRRLPEGSRERANLATILQAGERARDLVRQILAFSRKETPTRERVDLATLARDSLKMVRASLPATIEIDEAIAPVPPVLADAGQLHQILINLVVNAAQAVGDKIGKVTVSVAAEPHCFPEEGGDIERPAVHLSVRDTGCGMDEATRQRIFEPFFTTKPVGEGTGLGLSVVHGIVAQHGGLITVDSRPGEGTRFDVYLPALAAEEQERCAPETVEA